MNDAGLHASTLFDVVGIGCYCDEVGEFGVVVGTGALLPALAFERGCVGGFAS